MIRIIGDPDNQRPDEWSSALLRLLDPGDKGTTILLKVPTNRHVLTSYKTNFQHPKTHTPLAFDLSYLVSWACDICSQLFLVENLFQLIPQACLYCVIYRVCFSELSLPNQYWHLAHSPPTKASCGVATKLDTQSSAH